MLMMMEKKDQGRSLYITTGSFHGHSGFKSNIIHVTALTADALSIPYQTVTSRAGIFDNVNGVGILLGVESQR